MKESPSRIIPVLGASLFAVLAFVPPAGLGQNTDNQRRFVPLTRKGAASELPVVKKVSGETVTIGKKTYQITTFTKITVNGESATAKDLKPGMQASVSGGVLRFGKTRADTLYKATRIAARADNKLEAKRKEFNRKQEERARELNRRYRNRLR